jgi:hypothetical protein
MSCVQGSKCNSRLFGAQVHHPILVAELIDTFDGS